MTHLARRTLELTALVALATSVLTACNSSGGVPAVLPGATVSAQLRESNGGPWVVGAASVSLRKYTGSLNTLGPILATASSTASGAVTFNLPGESASLLALVTDPATEPAVVYPTALGLTCDRAGLTVSDASARVALGFDYFFETNEGGGRARSLRSESGVSFVDMLVFSTKNVSVSGTLTCGSGSLPLSYTLGAGWNLVTARVSGGNYAVVTSPLTTTLVLRRASSVVVQ